MFAFWRLATGISIACTAAGLKTRRFRDIDGGVGDGLAEAAWDDKDIVVDNGTWHKIPSPFFGPNDPRPHPPERDFHDSAVRNGSSVVVLIAALQEHKLLKTLQLMFQRARLPKRVYAGIIQQNGPGFADALEQLCKELGSPLVLKHEYQGRRDLHRRQPDEDSWGHARYTPESLAACEPATRVRMYRMDKKEAKGPAYARARQPLLLSQGVNLEDFCMQIDAHTVFAQNWDDLMIQDWANTDNEYAVLSSYPTNAREVEDGQLKNVNNHWEMPHLCSAQLSSPGMVRNSIAGAAANLQKPVLSKFWGAGLSFSRCHAERDVPADPKFKGVFTGEEFARGARLWTSGYDLYSTTKPFIGTWYGSEKGGEGNFHAGNEERNEATSRMQTLLRWSGAAASADKVRANMLGFDLGQRRALEDYIALTGIDTIQHQSHQTSCLVKKWIPWQVGAQAPYELLATSPVALGTAIGVDPVQEV